MIPVSDNGSIGKNRINKHLPWFLKLFIPLASLLIFFLLLEGISTLLTIWVKFPPIFIMDKRLEGSSIRDFDIGYVNKPNSSYELEAKWGTCNFRINTLGLRNDEALGLQKQKNDYRILCIGDSTVFGFYVDQTQSYPYQLEEILNTRNHGTNYLVLNAGCPSYTSFQVKRYLETRAEGLKPDMIIISVGINDFKLRESEKLRDYRNGPLPFFRRLIFHTNTYLMISYIRYVCSPTKTGQSWKTPAVSLNECEENLEDMLNTAKKIQATVIFCPISVPKRYREVISKVCIREKVKLVEAEGALWRAYSALENGATDYSGINADQDIQDLQLVNLIAQDYESASFNEVHSNTRVMLDSVHPNPIGYRAIAEDLAAVIP